MQALIGRRYLLQDEIGAGSMGSVYRALDRLTGRAVALKRVKVAVEDLDFGSRGSSIDDVKLTLVQEFKILASLRHPNIISVLDYGFDDERQPYVTMELLENASTLSEFAQGRSTLDKTRLLLQVLQALLYLHRRGVLHRDLKPRNVLVIPAETGDGLNGQVKVLDFGLSVLNEQVPEGEVAGTPSYMAPELWTGNPASKAADMYSVGVMAYELFAEQKPFVGSNLKDLYRQVRMTFPDLLSLDVPNDNIRFMIGWMLVKDPRDRYDDANDVIPILRKEVGMPAETAATRESFLQAAKFVGREAEMAKLSAQFRESLQGRGKSWLIAGESGVGKSRLLDELRTLALVNGALVLRGQADREGNVPYSIWRDSLRWLALLSDLSDLEASVLKAVVPDIEMLLNRKVADAPQISALAEQTRLIKVVEQLFRRHERPIVLILEDLHWAGGESITLLAHLNSIVPQLPLMIVGSYRDDENPHLPMLLPGMQVLQLHRLSHNSTAELVEAMIGEHGRDKSLLALLQRETEGNTFFLVEMVRALAEEVGEINQIGTAPLPTHILTGGVSGIVRRRLARVPDIAQPLLRAAAVAGRQLDTTVLTHVMQNIGVRDDLDSLLSYCSDAAVLMIQDGQWYFAHNKLRDGVLDQIPAPELKVLHRQTALSIESTYQYSSRQTAASLAYHWGEAGDISNEEKYSAVAGEQALERGAYQSALAYLTRALELQSEADASKRKVTLKLQIGDAYMAMNDLPKARAAYEEALALGKQANYTWGVASSLNSIGNVICDMGGDDAADYFMQALQTAMSIRAIQVALAVMVGMASLLMREGDKRVAAEFIALALNHPAADSQTHYLGERLLTRLRDEMDGRELLQAIERGKEMSLREVTARILSE